jgi:hypothetical protein
MYSKLFLTLYICSEYHVVACIPYFTRKYIVMFHHIHWLWTNKQMFMKRGINTMLEGDPTFVCFSFLSSIIQSFSRANIWGGNGYSATYFRIMTFCLVISEKNATFVGFLTWKIITAARNLRLSVGYFDDSKYGTNAVRNVVVQGWKACTWMNVQVNMKVLLVWWVTLRFCAVYVT